MQTKYMIAYKIEPIQGHAGFGGFNASNFCLFKNMYDTEADAKKEIENLVDTNKADTMMLFILPCCVSDNFKLEEEEETPKEKKKWYNNFI